MLTVRSRRQQKVRVLCCCWFSRQPAPLHTRQDEQARPRVGPWQQAQASSQYFPSHVRTVQNGSSHWRTRRADPELIPNAASPPGTFSTHWAEPCRYGGLCASGRLLSIIAKLFLRETFSTKLAARRKGPIYWFKMSLQEKLDKIRSPKLQNQHQVVFSISKPF